MNAFTKLLTGLCVLMCATVAARAATLQAKVLEVRTGNTLVVSNTNRSVRVRLKSVAPPEAGQPFSNEAREHLIKLVLDQTVVVEYTHLIDGYLEARVFLNGVDVGSQMLRDGAVWYDHASEYELNDAARELYAECERAARAEKRGLWQQASPQAPWEFRRIEKEKLDLIASTRYGTLPKSSRSTHKELLSSSDLMGAFMGGSASGSGLSGLRPIVENGSFERWTSYESPLAHFSVMVPSNGRQGSGVSSDQHGLPVAFDIVAAGSERAFLVLVSGKGANENNTDASAIDKSIRELIGGMNQASAQHGHGPGDLISLKPVRDLKLSGYAGRQYNLTSEWFSGTARVYTKRMGNERQIFLLYALARPGGESVASQFLNSFKITE